MRRWTPGGGWEHRNRGADDDHGRVLDLELNIGGGKVGQRAADDLVAWCGRVLDAGDRGGRWPAAVEQGQLPTPDDLDRSVRLSLLVGAATAALITLVRR